MTILIVKDNTCSYHSSPLNNGDDRLLYFLENRNISNLNKIKNIYFETLYVPYSIDIAGLRKSIV